jgi:Leucine-rich repeat (LRR) protein
VVRLPDNIPPTAKLQSLCVEGSRLRSLPETIGRLSDLTSLRINGKFLNGLPAQFSQPSSLRILQLEAYPAVLPDSLTALEHVDGVSHFVSLASFAALQSLKIKSVPDSVQFGVHSRLTTLEIVDANLVALPASLVNLDQLRELRLYGISGLQRLPAEISRLTALTKLECVFCRPMNTQAIIRLTSLRWLALNTDSNQPATVAPLVNLEHLCLASAGHPTMPRDLTSLTKLTFLNINYNLSNRNISTTVIPALSCLHRLKVLKIRINDSLAVARVDNMLANATSITSLSMVSYPPGTHPFPAALATLRHLRELCLNYHLRNPQLPKATTGLSRLTSLSIRSNHIQPKRDIPDVVFSLTTLRALTIERVQSDHSVLPEQISRLQQLRVLELPARMHLCQQVTSMPLLERVTTGSEVVRWKRGDPAPTAVEELGAWVRGPGEARYY